MPQQFPFEQQPKKLHLPVLILRVRTTVTE